MISRSALSKITTKKNNQRTNQTKSNDPQAQPNQKLFQYELCDIPCQQHNNSKQQQTTNNNKLQQQ